MAPKPLHTDKGAEHTSKMITAGMIYEKDRKLDFCTTT